MNVIKESLQNLLNVKKKCDDDDETKDDVHDEDNNLPRVSVMLHGQHKTYNKSNSKDKRKSLSYEGTYFVKKWIEMTIRFLVMLNPKAKK